MGRRSSSPPGTVASGPSTPTIRDSAAKRAGNVRAAPLQVAASRRLRPVVLTVARTARDTRLTSTDLDSGDQDELPVRGASGVLILGRETYVGLNDRATGAGTIARLRAGRTRAVSPALPAVERIGSAKDSLVACHPAIGALSAVDPSTGTVTTGSIADLPGTLIAAQGLADGRIVVLTSEVLAVADSVTDFAQRPYIVPPLGPLFVGSWTPVRFSLAGTGLGPDDVRLEVPDGPDAGLVSYARTDAGGDPEPLLVAGGAVGRYPLALVEAATGSFVAETAFEVTDHWYDADTGPSRMIAGATAMEGGGGWGGGPNTPQNLGDLTHTGTWNTLLLLVDTSTARWPTTPAATVTANRTAVLGHAVNGVTFNSQTRSARHYYEENSGFVAASGGNPGRGLTHRGAQQPGLRTRQPARSLDDLLRPEEGRQRERHRRALVLGRDDHPDHHQPCPQRRRRDPGGPDSGRRPGHRAPLTGRQQHGGQPLRLAACEPGQASTCSWAPTS